MRGAYAVREAYAVRGAYAVLGHGCNGPELSRVQQVTSEHTKGSAVYTGNTGVLSTQGAVVMEAPAQRLKRVPSWALDVSEQGGRPCPPRDIYPRPTRPTGL